MRVLQVVQKPQRRGAEIFASQLSQALRRGGDDVAILYLYPYAGEWALPLAPGDRLLDGCERHILEKTLGFHPGLLARLIGAIQAFQPDVVQLNGARTVKYGAFAKHMLGKPRWVAIYRNIDNPTYWVRSPIQLAVLRRWIIPKMDGVIGVSAATLGAVQRLYALQAPAEVIPNAIDPDSLAAPANASVAALYGGEQERPARLLFVGSLTEQKRPDRFLRIAAQVRQLQPNLQIWLVGDGPLRAQLDVLAQDLGIAEQTCFWGYHSAVGPFIQESDLLLVTSDSDGIPAVVLEAGYLGVPAVASRVGGMAECIVDGETGILVNPEEEADIAQTVAALLLNTRQREMLGQAAADYVRAHFLIDPIAVRYRNFFTRVRAAS